ncbi:MAG: DMT family transporter [Anaerolineae bacterium]|nr:DMT family transporter [Anaerolineae bacterium]
MSDKSSSDIMPYVMIAVAIVAVSTASIFIRSAQREAPSLVIAAYRLAIASLILTSIMLLTPRYRAELRRLTPGDLAWALASGVFLGIHFATWISSLDYTTVLVSVVLVTTTPLWVALASALLLHERLRRDTIIGLALALAGGVLIALGGDAGAAGASGGMQMWGNFLALVGAWTVAAYWMIGRRLRARLSVIPYTWLVYGTAALVLLATVAVAGLPMTGYPAETYLWFVLLAVVPQLLGHSSFNYALAHLSTVYVSVATLGEPVGATLLALALLGEAPTPLNVLGGALILGGIFLASREEQPGELVAEEV